MTPTSEWRIPRPVWFILLSWGLAVIVIASLLSAWIRWNQRQQDQDMCALISVFIAGPEPVPGPAGDRSRDVQRAMKGWYAKRECPQT